MNTFQLKRGSLRIEGDRIFINGEQAKYVKVLHLVASLCWTVFFSLQAQKHYKTYLLTHQLYQLLFAGITAGIVVFWLYVGYTRGIKDSGRDEIDLKQIVKAQKKLRGSDEVPMITLFLNDNRRKTLEFNNLDDLHFADSLAGRGVLIVE
ncbi:hypothetical protein [Rufibacter hautae]|uniref:Uncharacterized protein n=1 Tax=Rufibacter hautae TaxID=2595005 RepID=A0A5B6TEX4_9BACT|nr:hypothetical protein [Rufibacter hautae]KAA3437790.1 hypothetical protein FOA19_10885 [Rufibacter hautae]